MDIILNIMRIQGLKFQKLIFLQMKNAASLFLILVPSLVLVSCGGGSGPSDEGENSTANRGSYNAAAKSPILSTTSQTKSALSKTAANGCQGDNVLLCENFEWSSSLAYQASEQDWQLKGWQFSGSELSGNYCNSVGVDDSQCALGWVQTNSAATNTMQKASYVFSEYGSTYNKIMLSWAAKWSANWLWDAASNLHVSLEATNLDSTQTPFISLGFNQTGIIEVTIAEDKSCGRDKRIIKSDKAIVLSKTNLPKWHNFQLTVEVNNSRDNTVNNDTVQLSINNEVVLSVSDADLSCAYGTSANTVSYMSSSYNSKANTKQEVLIDSVLLTM